MSQLKDPEYSLQAGSAQINDGMKGFNCLLK